MTNNVVSFQDRRTAQDRASRADHVMRDMAILAPSCSKTATRAPLPIAQIYDLDKVGSVLSKVTAPTVALTAAPVPTATPTAVSLDSGSELQKRTAGFFKLKPATQAQDPFIERLARLK